MEARVLVTTHMATVTIINRIEAASAPAREFFAGAEAIHARGAAEEEALVTVGLRQGKTAPSDEGGGTSIL